MASRQRQAEPDDSPDPERRPPAISWKYATGRKANVEIAVWVNEQQGESGTFKAYSVTVRRSYADEAGTWQTTPSYRPQDLLSLAHGLQKAYDWIAEEKQGQ